MASLVTTTVAGTVTINQGASGMGMTFTTPSTGQNSWITWKDGGTTNKWEIGKNTANKLYIYNYAASESALEFDAASHATFAGALTVGGNINKTGDLTLDSSGNIVLDADGNNITLKDGGTDYGNFTKSSNDFVVQSTISNGDILFKGSDSGSAITALYFDMSEAGDAFFNADIRVLDNRRIRLGTSQDFLIYHEPDLNIIRSGTSDQDIAFQGNDGGSLITALTLDMSEAGAATFGGVATFSGRYVQFKDGSTIGGLIGTGSSLSAAGAGDLVVRTGGKLEFVTNDAWSTPRMTILSDGNVGIGTTSPGAKLEVNGNVSLTSAGQKFTFDATSASDNNALYRYSTDGSTYLTSPVDIAFGSGDMASEYVRIKSSGKVGIGTNAPGAKLVVVGTGDNARIGSASDGVVIAHASGVGYLQGTDTGGSAYNALGFKTSANYALYIDTSDRVGIGTAAPGWNFQVSSATQGVGLNSANAVIASNEAQAANIGGSLGFGATNDYGLLVIAKVGGYKENATSTSASSYLSFETRSGGGAVSEKMRIDSAGKVGIGTTAPSTKLNVYTTSAVDGITLDGSTHPAMTFKGAGTIRGYLGIATGPHGFTTGAATGDVTLRSDGTKLFLGTTSAGPTLVCSGYNVGIGTTAPARKLDVVSGHIRLDAGYSLLWDNGHERIEAVNTGIIKFFTNNGQAMTLSGSNLGIGTASPGGLLDLATTGGTAKPDALRISNAANASYYWDIWRDNTNGYLNFGSVSGASLVTSLVIKDVTGYVGIGTNVPNHRLTVRESGEAISGSNVDISNLALQIIKPLDTDGGAVGFGLGSSTTETNIGGAMIFERLGSNSYGKLHFATKGVTTASADIPIRMTIDNAGNVGIGTTNPSQKLYVHGNIVVNAQILTPGGSNLALNPNTGLVTVGGALQTTSWLTVGGALTSVSLATSAATGVVATAAGGGWNPAFHSKNTNADSAPSYLMLEKISASPANGDYVGGIVMRGRTSTGAVWSCVEQWGVATVVTNGSQSSRWNCGTWGAGTEYPNTLVCNAGSVGIGTGTPTYRLDVEETTGAWTAGIRNTHVSGYGLSIDCSANSGTASYALAVYTGTSTGMFVTNQSRVGIGTATPSQMLDIYGNVTVDNGTIIIEDTGQQLQFGDSNVAIDRSGNDIVMHGYSGHIFTRNGAESMRIDSSGNVGIGTTNPGAYKLYVNGTFRTTGAATFDGTVAITGALSPLGSTNYNDNKYAKFGSGNDLLIHHDGTHSYISNTTGAFWIKSTVMDGNLIFAADRGDGGGTFDYFVLDGGSTTYSGGTTAAYTKWQDNSRIALGTGKDLQLYHDGSNSYITDSGTGSLRLGASHFHFMNAAHTEYMMTGTSNEGVHLYYNNAVKLGTISTGVSVTGELSVSSTVKAAGKLVVGSTATPTSKFQIHSTQSDTMTDAEAFLALKGNGGDGLLMGQSASSPYGAWIQAGYLPNIGTSHHYPLLLQPHGSNVGIGTTDPSYALDVNGTGRFTGALTVSGTANLNGAVMIDGGNGYFVDGVGNSYNTGWDSTNDDHSTWINFYGYQGGTTKYRDLRISDGKNGLVAHFDGSSKATTFSGPVNLGTNNILAGNGSAGAPSFSFTSDTNTGMYRGGTDILSFATAGVQRLFISGSGALTVLGGNGAGYIAIKELGTLSGYFGSGNSLSTGGTAASTDLACRAVGKLAFLTNNSTTAKMTILTDGNVGIGTTGPSQLLDVNGTTRLRGALYDKNNSYGTSGQVLSTTGSGGVDWITVSSGSGTVTSVTAGTGMTQSGTSTVNPTLNVIGSTGITANANNIALTAAGAGSGSYGSTSNSTKIDTITLDAYGRVTAVATGATGSVTSVATGTGLTGGTITSSGTISVTGSVCRGITTPSGSATPSSGNFSFSQSGGMTISASGSTVTFSSSSASDYRLKKNIEDFNSESWTKVKNVSCRKFDFDAEKFAQAMQDDYTIPRPASYGSRIGFIAHELEAAGIDGAVEGEKDGVDENGVPIYQKVSYTTLVPILWGALNESIRKIEILESKVQVLEDSS